MTERGTIPVKVAGLLAIRDALVADDTNEAYHQLRMMADPDCEVFLATHDHWSEWERVADGEQAPPAKEG